MKQRIAWLNAIWEAETICTPKGEPYCHQLYGYPVAPGTSRLNNWVPLQPILPLPVLTIDPAASVLESVGSVTINVTLSAPHVAPVQVRFGTSNGTAIAGVNYVQTDGLLQFSPGDTVELITVPILDANSASPIFFNVFLFDPVEASISDPPFSVITIIPDGGST